MNIFERMSGVCGFVNQRQPGGNDCKTTVQVGGVLLSMNVQGFQYPSLPVVPFHFSCLGALPIHLVLEESGVGSLWVAWALCSLFFAIVFIL